MCIYVCDLFLPVGDGKERLCYPLIGVLRLCPGNDRLDELPVCGVDAEFRGVLRGGAGLHPLADHRRAVLPGSPTERDGDRRIS